MAPISLILAHLLNVILLLQGAPASPPTTAPDVTPNAVASIDPASDTLLANIRCTSSHHSVEHD